MAEKYQKYDMIMELEDEEYKLWKKGENRFFCRMETYKEKRAVFFRAENLMPLSGKEENDGREYHLLLIGSEKGEVIHRDFGPVRVTPGGEGSFFEKFTGPPLDCYTHVLLAVVDRQGQVKVLCRKETPFGGSLAALCREDFRIFPFSESCDETGAEWYRIEDWETLPKPVEACSQWIRPYRHYIIGKKGQKIYIGIPGRFLQKEQPCRTRQVFVLWQPMRGGEDFFEKPETMTSRQQEEIFGYWIAEVEPEGNRLMPL